MTSTNGASSVPSAAARNGARNSSPPSVGDSTLLCRCTFGRPGMAPSSTSSIAGCAGGGDRDGVAVAAHPLRDPQDVDLLDAGGLVASAWPSCHHSYRVRPRSPAPRRAAPRPRSPPRRARRRPRTQREAGQRRSPRRTRGSARAPAPPRISSSRALDRRPLRDQLERERERVRHDLAQVADLQLDRASTRRPAHAGQRSRTTDSAIASSCISRSAEAGRRRAGPSPAVRRRRSRPAPSRAARCAPRRSPPPARSPATARSAASAASARLGRDERDQLALVRDVHRVDAEDLGRAGDDRAAPARRPRARPSRRPTRAPARSAPRRRRRASRRACSAAPGPAASSSASAAGHSERVSDSTRRRGSNSPRASMIAVPCSPIEPETSTRRPGRSAPGESRARGSSRPMPGRADVHRRRRGRARRPSCRRRRLRPRPPRAAAAIASTSARSVVGRQALLEDQRERQRERARARDGEVVDRAVDGQLADRAAGEAQRLDDEAVGRQRSSARRPHRAGVAQRRQRRASRTPARTGPRSASAWPCRRRRGPS